MRSSSTYRVARRNAAKADRKAHSGRFVWDGLQLEGSKNHSIEPKWTLFIPPVRKNKRLGQDEFRYERTLIPYEAPYVEPTITPNFTLSEPMVKV